MKDSSAMMAALCCCRRRSPVLGVPHCFSCKARIVRDKELEDGPEGGLCCAVRPGGGAAAHAYEAVVSEDDLVVDPESEVQPLRRMLQGHNIYWQKNLNLA